jgi:hypothetical protein
VAPEAEPLIIPVYFLRLKAEGRKLERYFGR